MSAIKTRSGVACILFYGLQGSTVQDTDFDITRATNPSVVIDKEQQFQEATLKFERDQFELTTQSSAKPVDYKSVGLEPVLELSISEISLNNLKTSLGESGTVTDGATGTDPRKLVINDNVNEVLAGTRVQVLPYPFPTLYELNRGEDATTLAYYNPFHTDYEALVTTGYSGTLKSTGNNSGGATASPEEAEEFILWRNEIITIPNGAIVDINQINLAFGLQTQRQIQVMVRGLPDLDNSGNRITFGSLSITS